MHTTSKLALKTKLFLSFFGFILSVLLVEGVVRLAGVFIKPVPWSDRPFAYFLPGDSLNLQDSEKHPKTPGTFRVAVVGDSFTFAPHMQLEDTFPKKLEQMFNLNPEAQRVEVLNRGMSGASTGAEVALVREALKEDLDLLILEITLNDAEPRMLSAEERQALFEAPWLKWRIFSLWKTLGFVAQRIHNARTVRNYIEYHTKFFKDPEIFERFTASLRAIAEEAQRANVPLVAMVFPLFDFPINKGYPFTESHKLITQALRKNGIRAIDLKRAYRNIPPQRLQVIPVEDNHPNEIAHRIAAENLLAYLVAEQLVPESAIPTRVFPRRTDYKSASSRDREALLSQAKRITISPAEKAAQGDE